MYSFIEQPDEYPTYNLSTPLLQQNTWGQKYELRRDLSYDPYHNLNWNSVSKVYLHYYRGKVPQYYFQVPAQKFKDLVKELGQPQVLDNKAGGLAIWTNLQHRGIHRLELVDEQVYNNFPLPHTGCLYAHIKMEIPAKKIAKILSMTGDMTYDPKKKVLVVRGMSLNYIMALVSLVCLYLEDKVTWYQIKDNHLVRQAVSYGQLKNPTTLNKNTQILLQYQKNFS